MKKTYIALFALLLVLPACSSKNLPAVMLMPRTVETSQNPITSSAIGDISVTSSPTEVDNHVNPENFKIALSETIKRANIFGDDINTAITINANIYKASMPGWGGSKEGDLGVHYVMTDKDKKILFEDDIYYKGTSDAFESLDRKSVV
jgi:hypothetical protein